MVRLPFRIEIQFSGIYILQKSKNHSYHNLILSINMIGHISRLLLINCWLMDFYQSINAFSPPVQLNFLLTQCVVVCILLVRLDHSWAPFVHAAPCSLVCFILSVFRLFVHKPVRLTMPVCVLSCAYCRHRVFVSSLTSTRCKVETITMNRVPRICTGLTLFALPVAFNTPSS